MEYSTWLFAPALANQALVRSSETTLSSETLPLLLLLSNYNEPPRTAVCPLSLRPLLSLSPSPLPFFLKPNHTEKCLPFTNYGNFPSVLDFNPAHTNLTAPLFYSQSNSPQEHKYMDSCMVLKYSHHFDFSCNEYVWWREHESEWFRIPWLLRNSCSIKTNI